MLSALLQSGHSSDPERVNAIELMHESISHLMDLRNTLKKRFNNPAFVIPYPTMNFGHIMAVMQPTEFVVVVNYTWTFAHSPA